METVDIFVTAVDGSANINSLSLTVGSSVKIEMLADQLEKQLDAVGKVTDTQFSETPAGKAWYADLTAENTVSTLFLSSISVLVDGDINTITVTASSDV